MGFPRSIRRTSPWGPLCQAGALSHMGWQKSWQEFWNPWLGTPLIMSTTPWNLQITSGRSSWRRESASFHMMDLLCLHQSHIKSALEVTKKKLEQDTELHQRASMSIQDILELLEFCLCNTYFLFQGQFYEQTQGPAMGSHVSPVVANLYMEFFWRQSSNNNSEPSQMVEKICRWHICHIEAVKERRVPATH